MNDALCFSNLPQIGPNTNLEFPDDCHFIDGPWILLSVSPNDNREVKISLRQRVRERDLCVLTSSFLVLFLGSYLLSL